jgi:hypothetical protein
MVDGHPKNRQNLQGGDMPLTQEQINELKGYGLEEGEDPEEFLEQCNSLSMQCFIQAKQEGKLEDGKPFEYPKILEDM